MARRSTILLIEDNPRDAELIQRALTRARLTNPIKILTDGMAGMEYLSGAGQYADRIQNPLPFLLLLDLRMPRLSGFELLEWIKEQADLKQLLVVILTSSAEDPDIARAYALGATAYLVKPGDFEQLVMVMKNLKCDSEIFRENSESVVA